LDEAENVSGGAAAKAMEELPRGMNRKRGRLLVMKRAQTRVILRARLLQLDVVADDTDDVSLLLDGIGEVTGVGHAGLQECSP
jgi:hypothetical protein